MKILERLKNRLTKKANINKDLEYYKEQQQRNNEIYKAYYNELCETLRDEHRLHQELFNEYKVYLNSTDDDEEVYDGSEYDNEGV